MLKITKITPQFSGLSAESPITQFVNTVSMSPEITGKIITLQRMLVIRNKEVNVTGEIDEETTKAVADLLGMDSLTSNQLYSNLDGFIERLENKTPLPEKKDNTILYLIGGGVALLLILLLFKKR